MSDLPVVVRELRDGDWALILDSWVNSVRFATPGLCWVPGGVRKSFRRLALAILEQHPAWFRILADEDDPDTIYSWSCTSGDWVHFVYTKIEFRRMGLATSLVPLPWACTSWTKECEQIDGLTYRPSGLVEVIRGLDQSDPGTDSSLGRDAAEQGQHYGSTNGRDQGGREDQARGQAFGVAT